MRALTTLFKLPQILRVRRQLLSDSDDVWATRIGNRALQIDGRTLHPRGQGYIDFLELMRTPPATWTVAGMRAAYEMGSKNFGGQGQSEITSRALQLPLAGRTLAARLYSSAAFTDSPAPAIAFFHGGGFVIGSLETHDRLCQNLAAAFGGPVIAVDYRLAPEHRLPAAFDDAADAYTWLVAHADSLGINPEAIALAGDSAGAAMAMSSCASAIASQTGPVPSGLGLIYPPFGFDSRTDSKARLEREAVVLNKALLDWFTGLCMPEDTGDLPGIDDVDYARFPPTSIVTCGFDPLRDEGAILAQRLRDAGVQVEYQEVEHLFHGFATLGGLFPEAGQMAEAMGHFLAQVARRDHKRAPEPTQSA